MKIVLDTNVLFAAFAAHGLCEATFELCLQQHQIVLSRHILQELKRHLSGKLKLTPQHVEQILGLLVEHAMLVEPAVMPRSTCRDKDDLPVLGTAVAACADVLLTGDEDLLALKQIGSIAILTPRQLHSRLANGDLS